MNPDPVILAFLAARYPILYTTETIATRVKRSGLCDGDFDTLAILSRLAKRGLANLEVDDLSGQEGWCATAEGRKRWILDGQLLIG